MKITIHDIEKSTSETKEDIHFGAITIVDPAGLTTRIVFDNKGAAVINDDGTLKNINGGIGKGKSHFIKNIMRFIAKMGGSK